MPEPGGCRDRQRLRCAAPSAWVVAQPQVAHRDSPRWIVTGPRRPRVGTCFTEFLSPRAPDPSAQDRQDRNSLKRVQRRKQVAERLDLTLNTAAATVKRVTDLRVLFIGGTGTISAACERTGGATRAYSCTILNRGHILAAPATRGGQTPSTADMRDAALPCARHSVGRRFDVVVDFIAFTPEQVQPTSNCSRAAPASTCSSPRPRRTRSRRPGCPITESTPLRNPFWQYSRDKIACEELLVSAYRRARLPDHDRAPVAHLRPDAGAPHRGMDRPGPDAPRRARGRARRRELPVDAHPQPRLRQGVRRPARQPAGDRRQLPHHPR